MSPTRTIQPDWPQPQADPRHIAENARQQEVADDQHGPIDPEVVAARLGFDNLAQILDHLDPALRDHAVALLSDRGYAVTHLGRLRAGRGSVPHPTCLSNRSLAHGSQFRRGTMARMISRLSASDGLLLPHGLGV